MAKALAHFTITRTGDEFLLDLEDEDGESTEFTADLEQLDLIRETIDEQLAAGEADSLGMGEEEDDVGDEG